MASAGLPGRQAESFAGSGGGVVVVALALHFALTAPP